MKRMKVVKRKENKTWQVGDTITVDHIAARILTSAGYLVPVTEPESAARETKPAMVPETKTAPEALSVDDTEPGDHVCVCGRVFGSERGLKTHWRFCDEVE